MNQLDDVELLRKLDQVGLGHAIEELPDQVEAGFDTIN